jgi:hypothetical protein
MRVLPIALAAIYIAAVACISSAAQPAKPVTVFPNLPTHTVATDSQMAAPNAGPNLPPPPPRLTPIDWQQVREAVKARLLERVKFRKMQFDANAPQPSLPMLLPFEPSILDAVVRVFSQAHSYSASLRIGDLSIEVHGDRRAMVIDPKTPLQDIIRNKQAGKLAGTGIPFALDKTEGGFDLTFGRFGAAYLISIECRDVEHDGRCVKPAFIQALAEKMGLFGKDTP